MLNNSSVGEGKHYMVDGKLEQERPVSKQHGRHLFFLYKPLLSQSLGKSEYISSLLDTAQKMKFSIKDFFGNCDRIRRKLQIWSHLPKKSLMENFILCAVRDLWKL